MSTNRPTSDATREARAKILREIAAKEKTRNDQERTLKEQQDQAELKRAQEQLVEEQAAREEMQRQLEWEAQTEKDAREDRIARLEILRAAAALELQQEPVKPIATPIVEKKKPVAAKANYFQQANTDEISQINEELNDPENDEDTYTDFQLEVMKLKAIKLRRAQLEELNKTPEVTKNNPQPIFAGSLPIPPNPEKTPFVALINEAPLSTAAYELVRKINADLVANLIPENERDNATKLRDCAQNIAKAAKPNLSKQELRGLNNHIDELNDLIKPSLPKALISAALIVLGIAIIAVSIAAAFFTAGMFTPLSIAGIAIGINIIIGVTGCTVGSGLLIAGSIFAAKSRNAPLKGELNEKCVTLSAFAKTHMPVVTP